MKKFDKKVWSKINYYEKVIRNDDKKFTSENDFREYVRRFMSNAATRHNCCYMGVWERGEETGRLHYHALVYVPDGEMIGCLEMSKECYDYKTGKRRSGLENTHLADTCGRNEFLSVAAIGSHKKDIVEYIIKYIRKSNERIFYSRGCPAEIKMMINTDDICCDFYDFVPKYIMHDDFLFKLCRIKNRLKIKGEFCDTYRLAAS